eukprot:9493257-Pyramimonas_sp.AAC.2
MLSSQGHHATPTSEPDTGCPGACVARILTFTCELSLSTCQHAIILTAWLCRTGSISTASTSSSGGVDPLGRLTFSVLR